MFYRRNLPHWFPEQAAIFITFRLAGTQPGSKTGPDWLKDRRVANIVEEAILYGASTKQSYDLYAWVIMPNHVHILIQPKIEVPQIMRWLKATTARRANRLLDRTRPFWQTESFDHWIRRTEELEDLIAYIGNNPVRAGLVSEPSQWPWSSTSAAADLRSAG